MGAERDANLHQPVGELQQIREANMPLLHFTLLFPRGELGWHLEVWYQSDATSHNNRISCRYLPLTDSASSLMGTHCSNVLQDFFLCIFHTTEKRVPSLHMSPGSIKPSLSLLPGCYSHEHSSN
jgi:hypothetical protein